MTYVDLHGRRHHRPGQGHASRRGQRCVDRRMVLTTESAVVDKPEPPAPAAAAVATATGTGH